MFAGMAVWILLLDPLPKGESPAWSGWRGRDVLLTITAAFCLRGMESRQIDFFAPRADGRGRPWAAVAGMLLLGIALGPCVEELLFRGVVYAGLRNELGVWAAVPLSALLFGLFHLEAGWTAVAVTTGMGAAFALLVEGSGSLWPAVLAHVLINTKMIAAFVRSLREPEKKNGNREGIVAPISH
jgi:membrane protease YdiL (CAAX protease family)